MRNRENTEGNMNVVGTRVSECRIARKLKQRDIVDALKEYGVNITLSGYSKLEGQVRRVTDYELIALSKVFGVSISWLCGCETGDN